MQLCGFEVGLNRPLFLIAGPCVIESEQMALDTAGQLKEIAQAVGVHRATIYNELKRGGEPYRAEIAQKAL